MDQPPALRNAEAVREAAYAMGADVWESDLADIAALPLSAMGTLQPLPRHSRLLEEVLRARCSIKGGSEGGGGNARAD